MYTLGKVALRTVVVAVSSTMMVVGVGLLTAVLLRKPFRLTLGKSGIKYIPARPA